MKKDEQNELGGLFSALYNDTHVLGEPVKSHAQSNVDFDKPHNRANLFTPMDLIHFEHWLTKLLASVKKAQSIMEADHAKAKTSTIKRAETKQI